MSPRSLLMANKEPERKSFYLKQLARWCCFLEITFSIKLCVSKLVMWYALYICIVMHKTGKGSFRAAWRFHCYVSCKCMHYSHYIYIRDNREICPESVCASMFVWLLNSLKCFTFRASQNKYCQRFCWCEVVEVGKWPQTSLSPTKMGGE